MIAFTIATWSREQAETFLSKLEHAFNLLAKNPGLGRACEVIHLGLRRFEIERHVVFYISGATTRSLSSESLIKACFQTKTSEIFMNQRVAVITGGAQGIGRRTSEVLAGRGYKLAIIDLNLPASTLDAIGSGTEAMGYAGDITNEHTIEDFARQVFSRFERVDVLVNNAGISLICPAEETSLADYRRVMDVNLVAPFLLARTFGARMLEARSGSIVNVASVAGLLAVSDRAAYNASKHGLIGLTRTLAAEWGGRGVRVNAVCPGWVKTEMDAADQAGGSYSDADIAARVPMGRFASADDVARAIAFLADENESSFINGHCLSVDGGWASDGSWESVRLRKR